jgi:hypothetical protein
MMIRFEVLLNGSMYFGAVYLLDLLKLRWSTSGFPVPFYEVVLNL